MEENTKICKFCGSDINLRPMFILRPAANHTPINIGDDWYCDIRCMDAEANVQTAIHRAKVAASSSKVI